MGILRIFKKPSENDKCLKEKFDFLKNVKYKPLEKALTDKEVEEFEKLNNVTLPEDYKYFLTHIGNGICIINDNYPYKSWNPRGANRQIWGIERKKLFEKNDSLAKNFLFDKPFLRRDGAKPLDWFVDCINPLLDNDANCEKCGHFKVCPFVCVEALDTYQLPYYNGALPICYAGCTYRYCLVLTGGHRGEVWMDNELDDFVPSKPSFCEFLAWVSTSPAY